MRVLVVCYIKFFYEGVYACSYYFIRVAPYLAEKVWRRYCVTCIMNGIPVVAKAGKSGGDLNGPVPLPVGN